VPLNFKFFITGLCIGLPTAYKRNLESIHRSKAVANNNIDALNVKTYEQAGGGDRSFMATIIKLIDPASRALTALNTTSVRSHAVVSDSLITVLFTRPDGHLDYPVG
jgi:hypothetical protein